MWYGLDDVLTQYCEFELNYCDGMLKNIPPSAKKLCVNTGNILSLNEVKKKAGQNPTDELIESLKITLKTWQPTDQIEGDTIQVYRNEDDLAAKLDAEDRKGLKISVKVFVSSLKKGTLEEALNAMFTALNTPFIDSLVLAYPNKTNTNELLADIQELWTVLEEYAKNQQILSIGVSDLETEVFVALHSWANVKPSIIQINLASCCVVPPALQEFTKGNDVQLLTHSDPFEILSRAALKDVFGVPNGEQPDEVLLDWALRFQVHVKCRGVLSSKGYLVCVHSEAPEGKDDC